MSLGIGTFYLYLDGRLASDDAVSRLNHWIPKANVKLIPRTLEFRDASAGLRTWNESWLAPFFHLPCNSDLFVKQNLNLMVRKIRTTLNRIDPAAPAAYAVSFGFFAYLPCSLENPLARAYAVTIRRAFSSGLC